LKPACSKPARGLREVDAEAVGDRHHRDLVVDLAFFAQLHEEFDQRVDILLRRAEEPEAVRPALCEFGSAVGDGAEGQLRIIVLVEGRTDGKIDARAPRRQQKIDLVLLDQTLDRAYRFFGVRAVVIFDDFDRNALAVCLEHQAALGVHFLNPELVVRDLCDVGATGIRAGLRYRITNLDHFRCRVLRRQHRRARGECHCRDQAGQQFSIEFHGFPPCL